MKAAPPPSPPEGSAVAPGSGRGLAAADVQRTPPAALLAMPLRRPALTTAPTPALAPVHAPAILRAERLERYLDRRGAWLAPPAVFPATPPQVLAVTTMKNEAPFVLEWIAYLRVIGIGHALVYTNDCADPTVPMLDRLAELGLVTRYDNPHTAASPLKPQHAALRDAMRRKVLRKADWVAVIDVDEFPAIHVGDGTIADLLRAMNYPNMVSLTWRFFGNGGIARYVDRPVIAQFTRCAPEVLDNAGVGWGFKTLFRRSELRFHKLGVHRPLTVKPDLKEQVRWVNGSGRVMPAHLLERGWRTLPHYFGYRLASLNHYALRSAESYLVKRDRGRVNHTAEDHGLFYWQRRNYISDKDARMGWILPRVEDELARLKADPALGALHEQAVAWHAARIRRLRADPGYARLFANLLRTAQTDTNIFLADIRPEDEPALQRLETPPPPVPYG